jgi:hypothetical protein
VVMCDCDPVTDGMSITKGGKDDGEGQIHPSW